MKRREFIVIPAKALSGLVLYSLVGELIPARCARCSEGALAFLYRGGSRRSFRRLPSAFFPATKAAPGQPKREWSFTSIANSRALTAKTNIAIPRDRGLNRFRNTAIRAKKRRSRFIAPVSSCWVRISPDYQRRAGSASGKRSGKLFLSAAARAYGGRNVLRSIAWRQHRDGRLEVNWLSRPTMSYRYQIDKYYGKTYTAAPRSLEQILRHPVKAVEDEDL